MAEPITLSTPLPETDLRIESMAYSAALSSLGDMRLELLSERSDIDASALLGKPMTVHVALRDGAQRHFNGFVSRFSSGSHRGRHFAYQATLQPWLWFLRRTSDCRIFQNLSVPDIVKQVFGDFSGLANFEFKLFREYRKWVYCVQYRESDYNFVARLLEHEGIYWYFTHADGEHKLVLVDSQSAHDAVPDCESLPFFANADEVPPDTEYVSAWQFALEVPTGKTATTSYDFERPSTSLAALAARRREIELSDLEAFDFQGDYVQLAHGRQWNDDRLDEIQTRHVQQRATTNSHSVETGRLLTLERHPRDDQNVEYLVTGVAIRGQVQGYEADSSPGGYQCEFTAIPSSQQFRPPRLTPKPYVQGPQTAVVVGPAGDEIHTDKFGRVKVQFHWDRLGRDDDKSSCWVRVSHPWAGKNFGVVHIPRMGQEVVVDFLEGDPDQPLVTGRVYNAEQMPPWELPANATQSGILTRSSKGGGYGNANALRFEDKKGAEQVWLHAEKNQDIEVENDETHWVGHDRKKTVDHDETTQVKHDRTETVDNNETITVHGQRTETVDKNETITIHQNRTETVDIDETISIGGSRSITVSKSETATVALQRTHTVGINETITVGAAQEITVGAMQAITVGASQTTTVGVNQSNSIGASQSNAIASDQSTEVGANQSAKIGGDRTLDVGGAQTTSVGKARSTKIGEDETLNVGKSLKVSAADSILLVTGDASITMKKDGSIAIKGKDITIQGSGKISVKADSDVVVKGSKVGVN